MAAFGMTSLGNAGASDRLASFQQNDNGSSLGSSSTSNVRRQSSGSLSGLAQLEEGRNPRPLSSDNGARRSNATLDLMARPTNDNEAGCSASAHPQPTEGIVIPIPAAHQDVEASTGEQQDDDDKTIVSVGTSLQEIETPASTEMPGPANWMVKNASLFLMVGVPIVLTVIAFYQCRNIADIVRGAPPEQKEAPISTAILGGSVGFILGAAFAGIPMGLALKKYETDNTLSVS